MNYCDLHVLQVSLGCQEKKEKRHLKSLFLKLICSENTLCCVKLTSVFFSTGPSTVSIMSSTRELTTLTVPIITQNRAVTHHSNTVRSRTKRTATMGLADPMTFTAKTDFQENETQTLETESPYEMSDAPDMSSTALMVTRTPRAPQKRADVTETTSDVMEQTHNPLNSQTELTISTTDTEPSGSSDFHTGPSEAHSTDADPTLTHNPLTSQTELTISTTDTEPSGSSDFHTGPSEAHSTDADPTLTHNPLTFQTELTISTTDTEPSGSSDFHTGPSEAHSTDADPTLTHNPLTFQTELTISTTDTEPSGSSDFHTGPSEAHSTDADPTLTPQPSDFSDRVNYLHDRH